MVALDGVALAALRTGSVAHFNEHRLSLLRARARHSEKAVRTVWDGRFHRLADDLGDEHTAVEVMSGIYRHPLEVIIINLLTVAERTCRNLEQYER